MSVFVSGEPALFMGRGEGEWKQRVREAVAGNLIRPRLMFTVASFLRRGNRFDVDNLAKPVLSAIAPNAQSIWLTVQRGDDPGVLLSEADPPQPDVVERQVVIARPPSKSVRHEHALPELAGLEQLGQDDPLGVYLAFGRDEAVVSDCGFEGPIKPLIDSLWPILGGAAGSPADHRIRELRVVRGVVGVVGAEVRAWRLGPT